MRLMSILRRLGFLILVIWAASTITFLIPRISPRNPVRERFMELAKTGGYYSRRHGEDRCLLQRRSSD